MVDDLGGFEGPMLDRSLRTIKTTIQLELARHCGLRLDGVNVVLLVLVED